MTKSFSAPSATPCRHTPNSKIANGDRGILQRGILVAPRDDRAARATAMQIGPVAFFTKLFNDEKFLDAVRVALAQAENLK